MHWIFVNRTASVYAKILPSTTDNGQKSSVTFAISIKPVHSKGESRINYKTIGIKWILQSVYWDQK